MVCINKSEKFILYVASIAVGFFLWSLGVLFRLQIIGIFDKYLLINPSATIMVIMSLPLIMMVMVSIGYYLLNPAPKNCINIMNIIIIGIFFGVCLAFVIFEPLIFLGLGSILVIIRIIGAILLIGFSIGYLLELSPKYNPKD